MIVSVNSCRLMNETRCFTDKRDDKTTHYLKPPQAYVTIVFVEIIKRKAQPQQTQIQDNLIACV